MSKFLFQPLIIMPYKDLENLVDAAKEINQLKQDNRRLREQLTALRIIQQECLEKIREIDRYL